MIFLQLTQFCYFYFGGYVIQEAAVWIGYREIRGFGQNYIFLPRLAKLTNVQGIFDVINGFLYFC